MWKGSSVWGSQGGSKAVGMTEGRSFSPFLKHGFTNVHLTNQWKDSYIQFVLQLFILEKYFKFEFNWYLSSRKLFKMDYVLAEGLYYKLILNKEFLFSYYRLRLF